MINSQHPRHTRKKQEDVVLIGKLTMKPGGQLLLNEKPCTVEVPESLSELGSVFLDSLDKKDFDRVRSRPQLSEMWFGTHSVMLAPGKKRNHYLVIHGFRIYVLSKTLKPSQRNSLKVLVLPSLSCEEIAYHIAHEAFGDPLLHLLFVPQEKNQSSVGTPRKGHCGNLMRTLNDAIDNLRILGQSICQFLNLSRGDLECLRVERDSSRDNLQPEESQEKVGITPSEAKSNQGNGLNAEVLPDPTPVPESIRDETPDAKATVNSSNVNDLPATSVRDNELEPGDAPDSTHICDTTKPEESETSTTTDPAPPDPQES